MYYNILDRESEEPVPEKRTRIGAVVLAIVFVSLLAMVLTVGILISLNIITFSNSVPRFDQTIEVANLASHLNDLLNIATENGGTRAIGAGYNASAEYIYQQLQSAGCLSVFPQYFPVNSSVTDDVQSKLIQLTPLVQNFVPLVEFANLRYSANKNVNSTLAYVGGGCFNSNYTHVTGQEFIALADVTKDCNVDTICSTAVANGAKGILLGSIMPSLPPKLIQAPSVLQDVPVFGIDFNTASSLINQIKSLQSVTMSMISVVNNTQQYTYNIIANTLHNPTTTSSRVIVLGSHLDSVPAGPGINDNGSGSSVNLEIALQYCKTNQNTVNPIRFAWWAAEELGLKGSSYYVSTLTPSEISQIALNINMDMVASPNYFRGIYDGANAPAPIQQACGKIASLFVAYFAQYNLTTEFTPFDGRSDYGPFIAKNIPAGGLFTGAEKKKDLNGRTAYGGLCNAAFDSCYHRNCDTVENIDYVVLEEMARAAASVLMKLATEPDILSFLNGSP